MKSRISHLICSLCVTSALSFNIFAEVTDVIDAAKLPYGVADVVKLSRAQVSEEVIVSYIKNAGTGYNLNANEIVYLRNQGVSERVINVMLDQRTKVNEAVAQNQPAPAQPAVDNAAQPAMQAPVYTQAAPANYAPASTVHVIPYPAASYAYYNSYRPYYYPSYYSYPYYSSYCGPYYGGYYGGYYPYYRPGISFSFGFGHGYGGYYKGYGGYHHGYRGHGGYHHGHGGHGGHGGHHGYRHAGIHAHRR